MKSSEQIAEEWGLSKITINDLCNKGKIPGAVKQGRKGIFGSEAFGFFVYKTKTFWKDFEHGYASCIF